MALLRVSAFALALASTVGVADLLSAQPGRGNAQRNTGRTLFSWSGTVDREVTLVMRDRDLTVRGERAIPTSRGERPRTNGALPRTDGIVRVRMLDGRGQADVVQQPTSRNNYTTAIRIRDPQGGADRYRIAATWEPEARSRNGQGNARRDNDDRGRDRDDDKKRKRNGEWERDDDRDGTWGRDDDRDRDGTWGRDSDRDRDGTWGRDGDGRISSRLRWSGVVDDVVELRIQGRRVDVVDRSGSPTRDAQTQVRDGLPRESVRVQLVRADGRGTVRVVQQPTVWNLFTAVVRIEDPRSGASRYDLDVGW